MKNDLTEPRMSGIVRVKKEGEKFLSDSNITYTVC